ncbi:glycoside hydrolase family 1 protein [uncultured Sphingomonas sp.]|uniref:glycoside hydrolase family 1 protein n=1 Tax=uncultured Sphingomonas sp. TaxID=158754 RepID=UPI0025F866BA|nr:family 1 glycosylhydrolase [uncultured Sphingomonas sp.]
MTSRRALLAGAAAGAALPALASARAPRRAPPIGFLWGAATAGHQVEGGNVNSDSWVAEHVKPGAFAEPSGDACDSYHRYAEDIAIVRAMGLNTYRFGIEWSRIEPERGEISRAALDHYRRMIDACRAAGLHPFVTYSHFTVPRWFAGAGGWEEMANVDAFVRFCETATRALGDGIGHALTFNEPNLAAQLRWMPFYRQMAPGFAAANAAAARAIGADRFVSTPTFDVRRALPVQLEAHRRAREAIKSVRPDLPVGLSLALNDEQPGSPDSGVKAKIAEVHQPWFEAARADDFIGVQTYGRTLVGADADLPPPPGIETTQTGMTFSPEALGATVRLAARMTGRPVIVTENGIATEDDARRIVYIDRALAALRGAMAEGVDVHGYIHWSLLDNFEWNSGYRPKFGLVAVDRATFRRTPKPSARHFGAIAAAAKGRGPAPR